MAKAVVRLLEAGLPEEAFGLSRTLVEAHRWHPSPERILFPREFQRCLRSIGGHPMRCTWEKGLAVSGSGRIKLRRIVHSLALPSLMIDFSCIGTRRPRSSRITSNPSESTVEDELKDHSRVPRRRPSGRVQAE